MPVEPLARWEEYKVELCTDYMQQDRLTEPTDDMVNQALLDLQDLFAAVGVNMAKDFKLPQPEALTFDYGEIHNL